MSTGVNSLSQQTNAANAAMGAWNPSSRYRPITQQQVSVQWARGINSAMGASGTGYTPVTASQVSRAYGGAAPTQSVAQVDNSAKGKNAGLATVSGFGFGAPIVGAFAERAALKTEAYYLDYAAKAAELEGRRQAIVSMDEFARAQARSNAAIGASGIGYEGSAIIGLQKNDERMGRALSLMKATTKVQVAGLKAQAFQLRRQARMAPGIATLGAVQKIAGIVMSYFTGGALNNSNLSGQSSTGTR